VLINLNPLIKLDGYYFLTECIGIPDLKERSTAFLSGWFQSRILRLPAEVPVIPRRRLPLFILYAFTSGLYSYILLFAVIRLTYNVAYNWMAEFALIPAGALAFGLFRSRLRSLRGVMSKLWERSFQNGFRGRPATWAGAATLLALLFLPLWRDRENAMYVVEPAHSNSIRAGVPGRVNEVLVSEGQHVHAGQLLLRMTSPTASAMSSAAAAQSDAARFQSFEAQLRGQSIGSAAGAQDAALHSTELARTVRSSLNLTAPVDGIVITRDPASLIHQNVTSGQSLLDLAETGPRLARVFVPASALNRIVTGADVSLAPVGSFSVLRLRLTPLEGQALTLPAGLVQHQDYRGIVLPTFYCALVPLPSTQPSLPFGSSGNAIIFGVRQSLFHRGARILANLVREHVW